ncbi:MAG: hypothetical protein HYW88_02440, partial [Candidatus Sungbacteria bacterium]|nr:hypothetical protein [Candidatus Sungbacteria bacterium]
MKKILLYAGIAIAVIGTGAVLYVQMNKLVVIGSNTTIRGDYTIEPGKEVFIKDGARLTIEGSLIVRGKLSCKNGPIGIIVEKNMTIDGGVIFCERENDAYNSANPLIGIAVAVGETLAFSKNSVVITNGTVQFARNHEDLAKTKKQINDIFDETGQNTGAGARIGPFIEGEAPAGLSVRPQEPDADQGALAPNVTIGGHWYIGNGDNPPPGLSVPRPPTNTDTIILNFNFGANDIVALKDFYLAGPDGKDGASDTGKSCNAIGKKGENAFRMRVVANNISVNNFTLELGNGGRGG